MSKSSRIIRLPSATATLLLAAIVLASPGSATPYSPPVAGSVPTAAAADSLKPLHFFAGRWACAGEFPRTGRHIASEERFAPDLMGRWLVMRHDDRPPFAYHALEAWGYDASQKRFINYLFDNVPQVREYVSPGWVGSRLTWTLRAQSGKGDRFVFERKSGSEYQVDYSVTLEGKAWILVDTLKCQRQEDRDGG
jgi:hypothetical protein